MKKLVTLPCLAILISYGHSLANQGFPATSYSFPLIRLQPNKSYTTDNKHLNWLKKLFREHFPFDLSRLHQRVSFYLNEVRLKLKTLLLGYEIRMK